MTWKFEPTDYTMTQRAVGRDKRIVNCQAITLLLVTPPRASREYLIRLEDLPKWIHSDGSTRDPELGCHVFVRGAIMTYMGDHRAAYDAEVIVLNNGSPEPQEIRLEVKIDGHRHTIAKWYREQPAYL